MWARERAAYSVPEVAKALHKDLHLVEEWESGVSVPSYVELEQLAYRLYKRPVAVFFFPSPPVEPDLKQSLRTLPESEIDNLTHDTRLALRQAKARQLALMELNDGSNPSKRKVFRDIIASFSADVVGTAKELRKYIGVDLGQQVKWRNNDIALKSWRALVEDVGVFVFKRSLEQEDVSGFCLHDAEFPIIYLNNGSSETRQIFTLFHELSHVLLGTNGITKRDDRYIESLGGDEKRIEVFCNSLTAEFLVPSGDFDERLAFMLRPWEDEAVSELARRYKVSREVILRRLLDRGKITPSHYQTKAHEWTMDYRRKKGSGGGDYYAKQAVYLGDKFLGLAFGRYYQGLYTREQLADYLDVKVNSVAGLEQYMLEKASSR